MKKTLQLLPLALLIVLAACSEEKDYAELKGQVPENDFELSSTSSLYYRKYIEPFVGKWFINNYDLATQTTILDADGNALETIRGRETREILGTWTFEKDGWGTFVLAKKGSAYSTSESLHARDNTPFPNDNLSPLFRYGNEFQWVVKNDSTMAITFYKSGEKKDTYDAFIEWPQLTNADKTNPYWGDNVNLTIQYTTTGSYFDVESIYPDYSTFSGIGSSSGNISGYTCDVSLTYILQRN